MEVGPSGLDLRLGKVCYLTPPQGGKLFSSNFFLPAAERQHSFPSQPSNKFCSLTGLLLPDFRPAVRTLFSNHGQLCLHTLPRGLRLCSMLSACWGRVGCGGGVGEGKKPGSLCLSVLSICNSLVPSRADQNNVNVRETLGCKKSKGYHFIFKLDFHVVSSLQRRLEFPGHCNVHHMSSAIIALQVLEIFYKSMPCGLGCSSFNLQTTSKLISVLFFFWNSP